MTEARPADRRELLRLKRAEYSSIVRSRKRKLRELYTLATDSNTTLNNIVFDVDAPPSTPAETKFLIDADILHGRLLDDALIPTWQTPPFEALKRLKKSVAAPPTPKEATSLAKPPVESANLAAATAERNDLPPKRIEDASTIGQDKDKELPAPSDESAAAAPQAASLESQPELPPTPSEPASSQDVTNPPAEALSADHHSPVDAPLLNGQTLPSHQALEPDLHNDATTKHVDVHTDTGAFSKQLSSDLAKSTDIPSSPDSTAQTATTPAVHEISTNTSPENEADLYPDREENTAHEHDHDKTQVSQSSASSDARDVTVEAQLLHESAAAGDALESRKVQVDQAVSSAVIAVQDGIVPGKNDVVGAIPPAKKASEAEAAPQIAEDSNLLSPMEMDEVEQQEPRRDAVNDTTITVPSATPTSTITTTITVDASKPLPLPASLEVPEETALTTIGDSSGIVTGLPTPKPSADGSDNPQIGDLIVAATSGKRRAPTVLFGKQKKPKTADHSFSSNLAKANNLMAEDYFTPLFMQTFAQQSKWLKNLDQLVHHARKTISTADLQASIFDSQSCKILKRVYHLQQQDKWSLRQPKRCPEPTRTKSHWDVLLQEMKWMRTDFREERKWKMATARNMATACAAWVTSTHEERKILQVNASIPPRRDAEADDVAMIGNDMIDAAASDEKAEADAVIVAADIETESSDLPVDFMDTISPSAIFAMQEDAVVFGLNPSAASDTLLGELPMYGLPLEVPQPDLIRPDHDPDASWRRPVVPVSRYIESPVVIAHKGPLLKTSRFTVVDEDSESDDEFVYSAASGSKSQMSAAAMTADCEVGLFDPSLKPVRERLHAGHQFRPPSEYPMPVQSFYEYRAPSQWTIADDDQLKKLVRELSYNWSLIASILSTKSLFASGAERRTPWECFERWVSLEGYPSDAARSPYFKIYQSRIDLAQRAIKEANEKAMAAAATAAVTSAAAQPKGAANVPPHAPVQRRRPTLAVRVERHRNQKYLAMIEAMRKLAKKREVTLHKQQQQASAAATRKANETVQQKQHPAKSPKELSRLRWERDQKLAERMAEIAQRQSEANRRQFLARSQGQVMGSAGVGAVPPQVAAQMAANSMSMAARQGMPGQHGVGVPGQQRSRMQMMPNQMANLQAHMAAGGVPNAIAMNNMQQAQLQQALAAQRMIAQGQQPDINLVLQARRIHDQQRAVQQQQQHVQHVPHPQHAQHSQQLQQHQQLLQQHQHAQLAQHTQAGHPQLPQHLTPQLQQHLQQQQLQQHLQQQLQQQQAQQQVQQAQQQAQQAQAQQVQQAQQAQQAQHAQVQHAQHAPQSQQMTKTPSVTQSSPNGVRPGINGVNQQSFLANSQAGMAQFNAANAAAMGSPAMNMATVPAGSARPVTVPQQLPPNVMAQLRELENSFRAKNPALSAEQARVMAFQNYSQIIMLQRATAMHAASGASPQQALAGTSPRQYAQLLRAQQAQQVQAQQAQHQGVQAVQGAQHAVPRQSSPLTAAQIQAAQGARQANGTAVANGALSSPAK